MFCILAFSTLLAALISIVLFFLHMFYVPFNITVTVFFGYAGHLICQPYRGQVSPQKQHIALF